MARARRATRLVSHKLYSTFSAEGRRLDRPILNVKKYMAAYRNVEAARNNGPVPVRIKLH
jgi:hypothetical protein